MILPNIWENKHVPKHQPENTNRFLWMLLHYSEFQRALNKCPTSFTCDSMGMSSPCGKILGETIQGNGQNGSWAFPLGSRIPSPRRKNQCPLDFVHLKQRTLLNKWVHGRSSDLIFCIARPKTKKSLAQTSQPVSDQQTWWVGHWVPFLFLKACQQPNSTHISWPSLWVNQDPRS